MSIHLERTQSLLQELLIEAISQLQDSRINSINIVAVRCSKGKYNAQVYIQSTTQNEQEKKEILRYLSKAQGILKEYVLNASGWFKCPNLQFIFDDSLEVAQNLEQIFKKIAQDSKAKSNAKTSPKST